MTVKWKSLFNKISLVFFVATILGAVVSILLVMPGKLVIGDSVAGKEPTMATVALAFVTEGTALAPPLHLMILFGLMFMLFRREDGWGVFGNIILILQGLLFTIATIGELPNPGRYPNMPGPLYVICLVIFFIIYSSVAVVAFMSLMERFRQRKRTPPSN